MEANTEREPALLEVKVNVDLDCYKAYYRYVTLKKPAFWILWLSPLLMIVPSFFMYHLQLLFIPGFFLLYTIILFFPGPRRTYQRLPKQLTESDNTCAFYHDNFQFTRIVQHSTSVETIRYEYIQIAHETKSAFYLQSIDKTRGMHTLDKKYFTPEQMETLRELFAEKLKK